MGNSQNKNAKNSKNTSAKSTNTPAQQCNTTIQPSHPWVQLPNTQVQSCNAPVQSYNVPVQSYNAPVQSHNVPVQSSNTSVPPYNVSIISSIKPPKQFMKEEEFFQTWPIWRKDFLIYRKIVNNDRPDNGMCGNMLLNIMGPIGQQIIKRFTFNSLNDKNNLNVLLNKFDEYHTIVSIKRLDGEDTFMYINHLQLKMERANIVYAKELRNKISKEIDKNKFTNAARQLLPSFEFSSHFNNLTLKEIAFIWKLYDCPQSCNACGNNHSNDETCPAMWKQCSRCNKWNHSCKRCPLIFVCDCKYCGYSHFKRKCPASNEICTKCKKEHHFSWKCQSGQILHCKYCGATHGASRSLCLAKDAVCPHCKQKGHFAAKC